MNITQIVCAVAVVMAPIPVQAATTVYRGSGDVFLDDLGPANVLADFLDTGTDDIDVAVSGRFESGVVAASLLVSDFGPDPRLSSTSVVSVDLFPGGSDSRVVTAVFAMLSGTDAGLFGATATAIFTFSAVDVDDGFLSPVDVVIVSDLAPVPLPASLPLLLAGFGCLAGFRRVLG